MADIRIAQLAVGVSAVEVGISGGGRPRVRSGVAWLGSARALRAAGSWRIRHFSKNIDFKRGHNQIPTTHHVTTQHRLRKSKKYIYYLVKLH